MLGRTASFSMHLSNTSDRVRDQRADLIGPYVEEPYEPWWSIGIGGGITDHRDRIATAGCRATAASCGKRLDWKDEGGNRVDWNPRARWPVRHCVENEQQTRAPDDYPASELGMAVDEPFLTVPESLSHSRRR